MTTRSYPFIRRLLVALLFVLLVINLSGCGQDSSKEETASADQTEDNGDIEDDITADDPQEQYIETYPRTPIDFTYNTLYEGTLNPEGKVTLLVIPIEIDGGDPMDEDFFVRVKQRLEGPYRNQSCPDVRQYYLNASYGQSDIEYDIMPIYKLGVTLDEWTSGERLQKFKYIYTREAIEYCISNYVEDPRIYDSDHDGYLDGVICIINEPIDVEYTSGCPRYSDYDVSLFADNAKVRMFVDTMAHCFNDAATYMDNAVSHELAHCFGIEDYYDYLWMNNYSSFFDLQSSTYGDWNPFSKLSVGWIDPYVITPDVEKVTIRLRNSAEYPDAILIPCGEWNGTPFDEYLLIDVFSDRGNNSYAFASCYQKDTMNDSSGDEGGVRVYHVDARLMRRDHYSGEGMGWFDDFSGSEKYSKFDVCQAYTNSTSTMDTMADSPDRDPDYHLLSLIPGSRDELASDGFFYSSYLFHAGDVFTMEKYSHFFPNYPLTNKQESLNYEFMVESYDDRTKEAVITIEKIR